MHFLPNFIDVYNSSMTIMNSYTPEFSGITIGVHDLQQASRKAEPGDYKHAVNDM